jgi:hypothetical protein
VIDFRDELPTIALLISIFIILIFCLPAHPASKPPKVPVTISIRKAENGVVYFQPMIAPMFYGVMEGQSKDKISKCYATEEPVAELKDGGIATNLVLECGTARIVVKGVDFN